MRVLDGEAAGLGRHRRHQRIGELDQRPPRRQALERVEDQLAPGLERPREQRQAGNDGRDTAPSTVPFSVSLKA